MISSFVLAFRFWLQTFGVNIWKVKWWYRCEYKSCIERLSDLLLIVQMNLCTYWEWVQSYIPPHRNLPTGEKRKSRSKKKTKLYESLTWMLFNSCLLFSNTNLGRCCEVARTNMLAMKIVGKWPNNFFLPFYDSKMFKWIEHSVYQANSINGWQCSNAHTHIHTPVLSHRKMGL